MATTITIEWNDRQVVEFFKSQAFVAAFNKHFSQQVIGFISRSKAALQRQMDNNGYLPLGITQYIAAAGPKSPTKVLRDTDRFRNSLKGHFIRENDYLSGVDFGFEGTSAKGLPFSKLARILEEGRTWVPTSRERFKIAMDAARRDAPEPEGKPKPMWIIPGRPFIYDTFTRPEILNDFFQKTFDAVVLAARERARAGK